MQKIILTIIFLISIKAQVQNYQDRYLYRTEQKNVCTNKGHDQIDLQISFDDGKKIQKSISGQSTCSQGVKIKSLAIVPGNTTYYHAQNRFRTYDYLRFKQEANYVKVDGTILAITQRVSVSTEEKATFDNRQYDCLVVGDGVIHNFGPTESDPASKVKVFCKIHDKTIEG